MMASRPKNDILALLAGMCLPLAFSPFYLFPLSVISLVILFALWSVADRRQAMKQGFLFGLGMFGVGVSWIYVAIHDFGHTDMLLAALLTGGFIVFLALYFSALAWLIKILSPDRLSTGDILLLLPAGWLCYEWFRAWFLTGFPWLELGVGQVDGPLAGWIPVIGVQGVSMLTALSASLIVVVWQKRTGWPLLVLLLIWAGGGYLQTRMWTHAIDRPLKVSLVQGNIPQAIKWDSAQLFKTLALYEARTQQHWDSDLIIWPENAVPVFYHQAQGWFFDPLVKDARAHETDLMLGLPVSDPVSGGYYNALLAVTATQQAFYYKRHLVPFGEYIPFQWLRGLIQFFDLPMSAFKAGDNLRPLLQVAGQQTGVSICYEDAFSDNILQALPEATLLVNVSNNAWYGDSLAPHQHLQISRSRALEAGRPLLRATTNGISAIIDFQGRVRQQSPQFETVVLTGWVQPRQGMTPYAVWRQKPLWATVALMWLLWGWRCWHHRRRGKVCSS